MSIQVARSEHTTSEAKPGEARSGPHSRFTTSVIDAAKQRISTLDFVEWLSGAGSLRRVGRELVGHCVLPDHDDKTSSFCVNPETDEWFCFGCLRGGPDAVRLACHMWGYEPRSREEQGAAAQLLHGFGHEIPPRPATWFAKNERQQPIRDAIDRARFEHLRRRLFRTFFRTSVAAIEDDEEREQEYRALWDATEPLARMMLDKISEGKPA